MRGEWAALVFAVALVAASCSDSSGPSTPAILVIPAFTSFERLGDTLRLSAVWADGGYPILDTGVNWISSDPSVVRIVDGLVTAVGDGEATINAKYLEASAAAEVSVSAVQWTYKASYQLYSAPAIGGDGTIYLGGNSHAFYAINRDGSEKWRFIAGNDVRSSPAIGTDGTIYVGSNDGKLYAFNPDGSQKWVFSTGSWVGSPSIGSDGVIYVSACDENLYAVSPDGAEMWRFAITGCDLAPPTIDVDGTVYVRSGYLDSEILALSPDGVEKWRSLGVTYLSSAAIGADGTLYIARARSVGWLWEGTLYAVSSDGVVLWSLDVDGGTWSPPVVGADGTIYFGADNGKLYAVSPNGQEKWERLTGARITGSPAIADDGTIYVGSIDHRLYAFAPDGTKKWAMTTAGPIVAPVTIGDDGTVYLGSSERFDRHSVADYSVGPETGWVYAISTTSTGLADAPWPKFGRDARKTGNAGSR